jgi:hypothetical protein
MLRATASKVVWVGRATVFLVGLAVIVAVVLGVASTALGANGKPVILGKAANNASKVTGLIGKVATGSALVVKNPSGGSALELSVGDPTADPATKSVAPMKVDSQQLVSNLNSDELDGKSEADFYAAGSKVADSAHADQADSATNAQNAADADTVDGKHASDFAAAYERTVVVSPVGTDTENGQALLNAISSVTDASASKPYLLHIEPATYDLGNGSLSMKPFVDIEGSGELNTVITSGVTQPNCAISRPGTVNGASNAEMRFLTVRNTGRFCSTAINNDSASPRLTHLTAENTGGFQWNFAVGNFNNSNPTMTDVTATVSAGIFQNVAVWNSDSSPTIRQSKLSGSEAALTHASGTGTVALTQLVGGVRVFGGTLQCFNNYNENMAAVTCP